MPQRDLLLPWLSAVDNAALALRIAGRRAPQARAQAAELFAELGLEGFEAAHPHELSGGMRQRVAFLRTLLSGKPVLCLDEPFGALDAITRAEMQGWLGRALQREPRTVVLVTHDVEEAVVLADRVAVLSPRPGRVRAELEVDLPRPRSRTDAAVARVARAGSDRAGAGRRQMRRRRRNALPAIVLVAIAARRVGALRRLGRDELLDPPGAPHDRRSRCGATPGCSAHNLASPPRRSRSGWRSRWRSGSRSAVLIHLSPPLRRACYPLTVGSQAVPIAVIAPLLVFLLGLRSAPKADRDRPDLLLPGRRHDRRRARRRRPRPAEAAAHARRLALAGLSLRRAAGGAAGSDQRRADRRHGRRDRRLHRRVPDCHLRCLRRAGPRDQRRPHLACRPRAPTRPRSCCSRSRSPASTPLPWSSAAWRRGPTNQEETSVEDQTRRLCSPSPAPLPCPPAAPSRTRSTAAHTKPFTVMLDWFPNADHAPLYSAIAAGDFRAVGAGREAGDPRRNRRTAEAAGGRQGRHGDLLRARAAARPRRRPEAGLDRRARPATR